VFTILHSDWRIYSDFGAVNFKNNFRCRYKYARFTAEFIKKCLEEEKEEKVLEREVLNVIERS
jgi:hypothetical protein